MQNFWLKAESLRSKLMKTHQSADESPTNSMKMMKLLFSVMTFSSRRLRSVKFLKFTRSPTNLLPQKTTEWLTRNSSSKKSTTNKTRNHYKGLRNYWMAEISNWWLKIPNSTASVEMVYWMRTQWWFSVKSAMNGTILNAWG